jgi:hypothetical protein
MVKFNKVKRLKTYKIACENTFFVEIEARTESEALKKIEALTDKEYNYPCENDESANGWDFNIMGGY